jgi:hypothetical protein
VRRVLLDFRQKAGQEALEGFELVGKLGPERAHQLLKHLA